MPITTKKPAKPTMLQKFRFTTENYLLTVAQSEMVKKYPSSGPKPSSKKGFIYKILPILFLPGFRITPWFIKRRLLRFFFVHSDQKWPNRPWEKS